MTISGRLGAKAQPRPSVFRPANDPPGDPAELGERVLTDAGDTGLGRFLKFEAFLTRYQDLRRDAGRNAELHVHALRYGHHFKVVPLAFDSLKNRQNRIGAPQYTYRLQTYQRIDGLEFGEEDTPYIRDDSSIEDLSRQMAAEISAINRRVPDEFILDTLIREARQAIDFVENGIQVVDDYISRGFNYLSAPAVLFGRAISLIERTVVRAAFLANQGYALFHHYGSFGEMLKNLVKLQLAIRSVDQDELPDAPDPRNQLNGSGVRTAQDALLLQESTDTARGTTDGHSMLPSRRYLGNYERTSPSLSETQLEELQARLTEANGWVPYEVRGGDTIESIAAYMYDDSSRWIEIAAVNRLSWPYIGAGERTARVGDILRIPVMNNSRALSFALDVSDTTDFFDNHDDYLFGVDVLLDDDLDSYDWKLESGNNPTDIQLVRGEDNFYQRLSKIVFRTERGGNLKFPKLGIRYNIGERQTARGLALLAVSFREAILAEHAVLQIMKEEIVEDGTGVKVEYLVKAAGGSTLSIRKRVI